jgi:hypothetical protein
MAGIGLGGCEHELFEEKPNLFMGAVLRATVVLVVGVLLSELELASLRIALLELLQTHVTAVALEPVRTSRSPPSQNQNLLRSACARVAAVLAASRADRCRGRGGIRATREATDRTARRA